MSLHAVDSVSCHAGLRQLCVLVQVDGIENPKVQSVYFPDLPLHKAAFANDGAQVSPILFRPAVYTMQCNLTWLVGHASWCTCVLV